MTFLLIILFWCGVTLAQSPVMCGSNQLGLCTAVANEGSPACRLDPERPTETVDSLGIFLNGIQELPQDSRFSYICIRLFGNRIDFAFIAVPDEDDDDESRPTYYLKENILAFASNQYYSIGLIWSPTAKIPFISEINTIRRKLKEDYKENLGVLRIGVIFSGTIDQVVELENNKEKGYVWRWNFYRSPYDYGCKGERCYRIVLSDISEFFLSTQYGSMRQTLAYHRELLRQQEDHLMTLGLETKPVAKPVAAPIPSVETKKVKGSGNSTVEPPWTKDQESVSPNRPPPGEQPAVARPEYSSPPVRPTYLESKHESYFPFFLLVFLLLALAGYVLSSGILVIFLINRHQKKIAKIAG